RIGRCGCAERHVIDLDREPSRQAAASSAQRSAKPSSRVRFPPSPRFRAKREDPRTEAEVCETEVCCVCDFRVAWHAEKVMTADVDLQGGVPSVGRLTPDRMPMGLLFQ